MVLTRKYEQRVVITTAHGERITLYVLPPKNHPGIRLCFDADPSIQIHRGEIAERIEREGGSR